MEVNARTDAVASGATSVRTRAIGAGDSVACSCARLDVPVVLTSYGRSYTTTEYRRKAGDIDRRSTA